jgi:hypothetical protein
LESFLITDLPFAPTPWPSRKGDTAPRVVGLGSRWADFDTECLSCHPIRYVGRLDRVGHRIRQIGVKQAKRLRGGAGARSYNFRGRKHSGQNLLDHLAVNVGKAEVSPQEPECELCVVYAEEIKHGGVEVVNGDHVVDRHVT